MRNLLSTTALIAPFLVGAALAQDAPATTDQTDPQAEEQVEDTLPDPEAETEDADDGEDDDIEAETDLEAEIEAAEDDAVEDDALEAEETLETEAPADEDALEDDALEDDAVETDMATEAEPALEEDAAADDAMDETMDETMDEATDTATDTVGDEPIVREQAPNELRVDWITGTRVYSREGENIGRISDLIFDEETNAITVAILSVGGFLGIGAKDIAVKFEELQIDFDAREIQLDLTREAADEAPEYVFRDRAELPAAEPAGGMDDPAPAPALD